MADLVEIQEETFSSRWKPWTMAIRRCNGYCAITIRGYRGGKKAAFTVRTVKLFSAINLLRKEGEK